MPGAVVGLSRDGCSGAGAANSPGGVRAAAVRPGAGRLRPQRELSQAVSNASRSSLEFSSNIPLGAPTI